MEFVRPLSAPMPDTINLVPGQTYDVAFAVWIGKAGETSWDKSISPSFIPLTISTSPPPSHAVSAIPTAVLTVAVIGIVIAVVAIGLVYYSIRRRG